jgi:hypothetical protein
MFSARFLVQGGVSVPRQKILVVGQEFTPAILLASLSDSGRIAKWMNLQAYAII